uniref:DUF4939 domain-containing protein n=1 Tax=Pseudonaja textilis TaxID=8673 RepID=A0A670ZJ06_PSETE
MADREVLRESSSGDENLENLWLNVKNRRRLRRKSPVSMPEKFSGQMDRFPAFMGQCQLFISPRLEDFPTDRSKVGFMISLLTGQAANWATPLLVQDSPLLNNFQGFLQQMRVIWLHSESFWIKT